MHIENNFILWLCNGQWKCVLHFTFHCDGSLVWKIFVFYIEYVGCHVCKMYTRFDYNVDQNLNISSNLKLLMPDILPGIVWMVGFLTFQLPSSCCWSQLHWFVTVASVWSLRSGRYCISFRAHYYKRDIHELLHTYTVQQQY